MSTSKTITANLERLPLKSLLICFLIGSVSIGLSACSDDGGDGAAGPSQGEEATLSDDFPGIIPIYEPSDFESASERTANRIFYFGTDASQDEVIAFYDDALSKNGWSSQQIGPQMFQAENGELTISITVSERTNAGGSGFAITVPKEE